MGHYYDVIKATQRAARQVERERNMRRIDLGLVAVQDTVVIHGQQMRVQQVAAVQYEDKCVIQVSGITPDKQFLSYTGASSEQVQLKRKGKYHL